MSNDDKYSLIIYYKRNVLYNSKAGVMSITQKIDSYVRHQKFGKVFSLHQLVSRTQLEDKKNAATAALGRMVKKEQVIRLSPGVYYRPKKSRFGHIPVDVNELIESISKEKKAAYVVAGAAAMNSLGLSTQLSMSRSYLISERVRSDLKSVNVKLTFSKSLTYFDKHLRMNDKKQRQNALLLWSALSYIGSSKVDEYRDGVHDRFHKLFNKSAQEHFLKALPPSMNWVVEELGAKHIEQISRTKQ